MKKRTACVAAVLMLAMVFLFAGCIQEPPEEQQPLTVADCFKDYVTVVYFRRPFGKVEDVPYDGSNVSLAELLKSENNIEAAQYSYFLIYTTTEASKIELNSISFDVVASKDCVMQFNLYLSADDNIYSDAVEAKAGMPATITFTGLHKAWSEEDAGNSTLRNGVMAGAPSTYLRLEPVGKDALVDNPYSIQNIKIIFTEL